MDENGKIKIESQTEERYDLVKHRILEIIKETKSGDILNDYILACAKNFEFIFEVCEKIDNSDISIADYKKYNEYYFSEFEKENYIKSYCCPEYILEILHNEKLAFILSAMYIEYKSAWYHAIESNKEFIVIVCEFFLETYFEINSNGLEIKTLRNILYYYAFDYADVFLRKRIREQILPSENYANRLFETCEFNSADELYLFGEYITDNEIKMFEFLQTLSNEEIDNIARTYVDAYYTGFVKAGKPIEKKKYVNIRYPIGMERVVKRAIKFFGEKGLKPVIYRRGISLYTRSQNIIGYSGAIPCKQLLFDHKSDKAIFYDKKYANRLVEVRKSAYEEIKEDAKFMAGPAVIETFGEEPFSPSLNSNILSLSPTQEKIDVEEKIKSTQIVNEYVIGSERSFTIISFPSPEIGDDFKEIFSETVKLNTLNSKKYEEMQQVLIDALDVGESIVLKGKDGNETDIKVKLHSLKNPDKETIFENCVADVNIPVGEVFTSPVLHGTNGILHVKSVYLNGLLYKDLKILFKNGMVESYSCKNFDDIDKGKKYIKDNLLYHHDSLPIGEFAIGTNKIAYNMMKKYKLEKKMPILIYEKTGPHFALGDTCYSHEEDVKVYNSDGKEIIARDNEISVLRNKDETKAYFGCHTDITIPYDELGILKVVKQPGEEIPIIKDGEFVLAGCEGLNL